VSVLLFNPLATRHNPRIPNSILQIAASINMQYEWVVVDGNIDKEPWDKIESYLKSGKIKYFGSTVMPGPQLKQAIPISKKIRELYPEIKIIWGGYFPSNHSEVVLNSGYVDLIVNGMGDKCFPALLDAFEKNGSLDGIKNLIYLNEGKLIRTPKSEIPELDELPLLPYETLSRFYSLDKYLAKTYLGAKTIAYHSSFGCPFTCSFCAVVPIYNARWKGYSSERIINEVTAIKRKYNADAVEFHDNNFFVSEKRVVEFSNAIKPEKMVWWGEGRIDTISKYKDESLALMSESGCKMIFFGAETGNDELLKKMDKGGTQTREQILSFASRLKKFNIIPEYSFVLGFPGKDDAEVYKNILEEINFIREVKKANEAAEIIIYVYSPVPTEGSELYKEITAKGFRFPEKLDDWISLEWENFDLRKNPLTPWIKAYMVNKIKDFETVLNGYYPTATDIRLSPLQKKIIKLVSTWRYKLGFYTFPYEIKLLQKLWKYRQPEKEGF
jgi:radical SAM superfamily enzyme YgiQ (UPF0313 family)